MAERIPANIRKEVGQELDKSEQISRITRGVKVLIYLLKKKSFDCQALCCVRNTETSKAQLLFASTQILLE